ncbi:hypothetical protein PQX77_013084 [Marasmius sp. AFHP31]|nr:hypothetical protein PQX77_013084 [Marasmius sp. AFHP31]
MPCLDAHDIDEAIVATAVTLQRCGYRHALFGSAACYLYFRLARQRNLRTPNDVDIIVFQDSVYQWIETERIKRDMVWEDSRFYLTDSKKPGATYKVLWFRPGGLPPSESEDFKACKVDILVDENSTGASSLRVPHIHPNMVAACYVNLGSKDSTIVPASDLSGGPVPEGARVWIVPPIMLLFLKLCSWEGHRDAEEARFHWKAQNDRKEITLLTQNIVFVPKSEPLLELEVVETKLSHLPETKPSLKMETKRRAKDFIYDYFDDIPLSSWCYWVENQLIGKEELLHASFISLCRSMPLQAADIRRYPLPPQDSRTPHNFQELCKAIMDLSKCFGELNYLHGLSGNIAQDYHLGRFLEPESAIVPKVIEMTVFPTKEKISRQEIQRQVGALNPHFYHSLIKDDDGGDFWYSFVEPPYVRNSFKVHIVTVCGCPDGNTIARDILSLTASMEKDSQEPPNLDAALWLPSWFRNQGTRHAVQFFEEDTIIGRMLSVDYMRWDRMGLLDRLTVIESFEEWSRLSERFGGTMLRT